MLIFWQSVVHYMYFVIDGVVLFYFMKHFFIRKNKTTMVYDIVYAYCCIPLVLRLLFIK